MMTPGWELKCDWEKNTRIKWLSPNLTQVRLSLQKQHRKLTAFDRISNNWWKLVDFHAVWYWEQWHVEACAIFKVTCRWRHTPYWHTPYWDTFWSLLLRRIQIKQTFKKRSRLVFLHSDPIRSFAWRTSHLFVLHHIFLPIVRGPGGQTPGHSEVLFIHLEVYGLFIVLIT